MSRQIKIRSGPPIEAALRATGGVASPTGRLNAIAERYLAMVNELRPALSRNEWLAIFDVLNSVGMDDFRAGEGAPRVPPWVGIADEIADAPDLSRFNVNQVQLANKIHALPESARIAIIETAQRFWAHPAAWPDTGDH